MKFDIFFYEAFEEEQVALRRILPGDIRAGYSAETIQRSGHNAPPASLLSIRTQSDLPIDWHPAVHGVLARSTGYDHLLPIRERVHAPLLASLPEYCSRAVAEQAALLWMALLRKLPAQQRQWAHFNRDNLTGGENEGRTLLVAGVGRIGHEVARIGRGLGMRVRGVDITPRHKDIDYVSLEEGIADADVVVSSMNLTPDNRGIFAYSLLRHAKRGCIFVNVARGELAIISDLARLLAEGILGGVGLDVFNDEIHVADALRQDSPHPEAERLRSLALNPNVILTPHNAFNTTEAVWRKADLSSSQVLHFLQHGVFAWPLPG
ncbi:MAG: hydroxyacid dehydrogenase [Verrucomicrobia bacterium]|nr:hydroxyacid dehydrogenase [Kiritimatiellia bacterium]MCO6400363.1 hydroxyacid dehydrogenase [Verrucomicrobiota bacterium]